MKVEVTVIIDVPEVSPTPNQGEIENWIRFELGYTAQLGLSNPLAHESIQVDECYFVSFTT